MLVESDRPIAIERCSCGDQWCSLPLQQISPSFSVRVVDSRLLPHFAHRKQFLCQGQKQDVVAHLAACFLQYFTIYLSSYGERALIGWFTLPSNWRRNSPRPGGGNSFWPPTRVALFYCFCTQVGGWVGSRTAGTQTSIGYWYSWQQFGYLHHKTSSLQYNSEVLINDREYQPNASS